MIKMYLCLRSDDDFINSFNMRDNSEEESWTYVECIFRGDGYFNNRERYGAILSYFKSDPTYKDLIIWTNDENVVSFAHDELFNGRQYGIDLFIEDYEHQDQFIDCLKTYENVRYGHNVRKMILSGVFGGIPEE